MGRYELAGVPLYADPVLWLIVLFMLGIGVLLWRSRND